MRSKSQAMRKQQTVSRFLAARRGGDQPLDSDTRAFMESRFRHDFSKVRVHADREAAQSAASIGASAYTAGSDIVFGAGVLNRQRLAHELTHVVQQSRGGNSSTTSAEADARMNANLVAAGLPGHVQAGAAPGSVQCDELDDEKKKADAKKLENEFSTGSTATIKRDEVKNKFAFSGEASIPLFRGFKLGPVVALDKLTLKAEGDKEIPFDPANPQIPGPADITDVQTEAAFSLIKAEVPKLEAKGFTLGAGLEASTKLKYATDKGPGLSADAKATLDAGYKSPSLLPKAAGSLNLGAKLKGTATAGVDLDNKQTAKATGKLTLGADYKSPTLRGPGGTLLGLLGDKANLSLGAEGTLTGTAETDNDPATKAKDPNLKLGVGGSVALTGAGRQQPFVKLKVTGEGVLNANGIDPASRATVAEISVGFKF